MIVYFTFLCCCLFWLANGSCPSGSLLWKSNCYIFNSTQVGFAKAETECMRIGGHLASIHDAFTNNIIGQNAYDYFQHNNGTNFWIGGNSMNPQNNWEWTDGSKLDFLDWKSGEPQNINGSKCMSLSQMDGYWKAENCYLFKPFVCAIIDDGTIATTTPLPKKCAEGWEYFEPSDSCYKAFSPNVYPDRDWQWAENFCMTFGAHSPSIHSVEEQTFLHGYSKEYDDDPWLGLYSDDNGTTWQYTDNSAVDYIKWGIREPNINEGRNCVLLATDRESQLGWFQVAPCSDTVMTVCRKGRE